MSDHQTTVNLFVLNFCNEISGIDSIISRTRIYLWNQHFLLKTEFWDLKETIRHRYGLLYSWTLRPCRLFILISQRWVIPLKIYITHLFYFQAIVAVGRDVSQNDLYRSLDLKTDDSRPGISILEFNNMNDKLKWISTPGHTGKRMWFWTEVTYYSLQYINR